ncbi:MAG: endonuclease [Chitinophagales bacterium]|nr:MAG: endonuclease [Chitinophagales bacterium]
MFKSLSLASGLCPKHSAMKAFFRMFVSLLFIIAGVVVLYIGGTLLYGTLTDFSPPASEKVSLEKTSALHPEDSIFTFLNWNIGYAGLGDAEDFFFDGGRLVRPKKERVDANLKGIVSFLATQTDADFILLQEVDRNSKRSYYVDEVRAIAEEVPSYAYAYAVNYRVNYVPAPLNRPWDAMGKVEAGLVTLSRFQPDEALRITLPGEFAWPKKVFWLDRCLLVFRFNLNQGRQLVIINQHMEAYDEGGSIKKQQMDFLKNILLDEYSKGNYIIVGGDWNQCPPDFNYQHFLPDKDSSYVQLNIPSDFMPGWTWAFDSNVPTNRKVATPYKKGETFVTLIDFYLVSPNVEVLEVKGIHLDFKYSDHQPVKLKVALR